MSALGTATRAVGDAMSSLAAYTANIQALAYLADVGPTTIMAAMDALGDQSLAVVADAVDNARELMGNQIALAKIASFAPQVYAAADALDAQGEEAQGASRKKAAR